MEMCFDNGFNLQIVRRTLSDVLLDISLRIYDYRFAFRSDQV